MIHKSKQDCFEEVLLSLRLGLMMVDEVHILQKHFEEMENYECCQGIVEAFLQYKEEMTK